MHRFLLLSVSTVLLIVALAAPAVPAADSSAPALILYDSTAPWAWLGEIYAKQVANLLGHFQVPCEIAPVEGYAAGAIDSRLATFYIGSIYDNPLPRAFRNDVLASVILVVLGFLINPSYAHRPRFNIGVLRLVGLAYLVGTLLYGLPLTARGAVAALFLLNHWAAIRFVPIPGVGTGVFSEEQNLIKYLHEA
jgi:hypothetical protein